MTSAERKQGREGTTGWDIIRDVGVTDNEWHTTNEGQKLRQIVGPLYSTGQIGIQNDQLLSWTFTLHSLKMDYFCLFAENETSLLSIRINCLNFSHRLNATVLRETKLHRLGSNPSPELKRDFALLRIIFLPGNFGTITYVMFPVEDYANWIPDFMLNHVFQDCSVQGDTLRSFSGW